MSPNELVFRHSAHGPLAALKDNGVDSEPLKTLAVIVNRFRCQLFVVGFMAKGTDWNEECE